MGLLFVLIVFAALFMMARSIGPNKLPTTIVVKACPPHKWRHIEIKDQNGNTVKWTMVCDVCGPLRPLDAPDRTGY
jgi:hypothetical protein